MIDLQACRVVGTVVLGGGLVGCATAVALAEANAREGKATVVLESGPAQTFRETTPSQGSVSPLSSLSSLTRFPERTNPVAEAWTVAAPSRTHCA